MLIQTLRKQITVTSWYSSPTIISVSYFRSQKGASKPMHIILSPIEYLKTLDILAMIDGVNKEELMAIVEDDQYYYEDFIALFPMCQWEALEIAIRHELGKDSDEEIESLELDSAINALK